MSKIYENISRKDYVALEGINASSLKPYYESALNGNYEKSKPWKTSDAMEFGTACHSLILEEETFNDLYARLPYDAPINPKTNKPFGTDTKKYMSWIEDMPKSHKFLSDDKFELLEQIQDNIFNHKSATQILKACPRRETAITWTMDGIKCKALIDFMGGKIVGDFKTTKAIPVRDTTEATQKAIFWDLVSTRNLLQFAFYMDGCIANGLDVQKFAVIFAKNNGNCDIATTFLSETTLDYGREMYKKAIQNWQDRDSYIGAFAELMEV